ncbi:hypothetical protein [Vibrio sp. D431a]|uniref:hypothetical protein n=1 Tax=Vibrio sp. D431a TaxID=2837388 RepID=UPI002554B202|nr:hypothetical protein [Vibrio sp. D431a]MDK9790690.1 hypothetical protein [Vibrio sp. D431a]
MTIKRLTIRERSNRLHKKLLTGDWAEMLVHVRGTKDFTNITECVEFTDDIFDKLNDLECSGCITTGRSFTASLVIPERLLDLEKVVSALSSIDCINTFTIYDPVDANHSYVWDEKEPFEEIERLGVYFKTSP